jgi:type IV pilus assembly protein PilF
LIFPPTAAAFGIALQVALMSAFALVLAGCVTKQSLPGAQSPERQSDAEYDLALEYFRSGQPRVALDHAQKAIALNDQNAKALYFASTIYLWFCSSQGMRGPDCRLGEAEKFARLSLKADSSFRDAKNLLGNVLINEDKFQDAIAVLTPLVNDPAYVSNYLAWGNLGWAQVQNGAVDEGISSLKNAVTQPRFCVGHYHLGIAYEKKGELAQAESSLTTAVQVDSADCQNLQDAWEARGRVRVRLGKTAEAHADFQRCKEISAESLTGKKCLQELAP